MKNTKVKILSTILLSENSTHEQRLKAIGLLKPLVSSYELEKIVNESIMMHCKNEADFLNAFNRWIA